MRLIGQTLLASVFVLGACAGGEKKAASDTAAATAASTPAAATTTPAESAAAPATGATTAAPTSAAAPITGQIHEVKMIGDQAGYRFDPANITIKAGDGIKWVTVSGGPHNVTFDSTAVPAGAADKLKAAMPNQMAPLESNFFMQPNETYTVSFAGMPKGTYKYFCTPHQALGMKGTITVQ